MEDGYPPIADFSAEGRKALVQSHGQTILLLLDEAFTAFLDRQSLAAFGFDAPDPVAQAVQWSMQRFVEAEIDPSQLHPSSRSFRLFTEVGFWLSQKVGTRNLHRILKRAYSPDTAMLRASSDVAELTLTAVATRLGVTLKQLRQRTCADLVGLWLAATASERAQWFGWREDGQISDAVSQRSKKDRSLFRSSALFRFQCLHHELLRSPALEVVTAIETLLAPCKNAPPYRREDVLVTAALPQLAQMGQRELRRLVKEGCSSLLSRLISILHQQAIGEAERLEWSILRMSLTPSTLHALDLEKDSSLSDAIRQLPSPLAYLETEQ